MQLSSLGAEKTAQYWEATLEGHPHVSVHALALDKGGAGKRKNACKALELMPRSKCKRFY